MSKKYSLSTQIFFNPVFILFIFFLQCSKPPTLLNTVGYKKAQSSINSIIQSSGLQTNIGIKVIDLKTNETIYAWNPNSLFNPGSNNKLFTCITALALLDTNKTFSTSVYQDTNAIYLVAGGDPHLSIEQLDTIAQTISDTIQLHIGRDYWFLNNRLRIRSVDLAKKINYLVVDNSIFDNLVYGPGWMWDEGSWWHAGQISAMTLNENCVDFFVSPGKLGYPNIINTYPTTNYITIKNESITVNDTIDFQKFRIERDWENQTNNFLISGNIMDTATVDTLQRNIHNPTLYAGTIFAEMLQNKGLNIKHIVQGSVPNNAIKITEHVSESIMYSLNGLMKDSENLTAELIVKHIGSTVYDTVGTWKNGLLAIKTFLHDTVGIDTNTIGLSDGSGLSRYNYSSPNHFITLLSWAYNNKNTRNPFLNTFPIGGLDGTLVDRLEDIDTSTTILAKTGSLSGVNCLSGYIVSKTNSTLAFSILMNGFVNSSKPYRKLQDDIIYALTKLKL